MTEGQAVRHKRHTQTAPQDFETKIIDVELRSVVSGDVVSPTDGEQGFTDMIQGAFGGMVNALIGQPKPMTPNAHSSRGKKSGLFNKKSQS